MYLDSLVGQLSSAISSGVPPNQTTHVSSLWGGGVPIALKSYVITNNDKGVGSSSKSVQRQAKVMSMD